MRFHIHRWHIVAVAWGRPGEHLSTHPHTRAYAVCKRSGCEAKQTREFPGANLTVEAARRAWRCR